MNDLPVPPITARKTFWRGITFNKKVHRRSVTTVMTTPPLILGASINYSRGCDPRGASVPLHPQRRDVRTIVRHTIYKHLIEESNATRFHKENRDVTKTYKEIRWS